jgi:hypothetical protein
MAFEKSSEYNIGILYKDIHIDFLRRVDSDCTFICENGREISEGVLLAYKTGERVNVPVTVKCYVLPCKEPCVIGKSTLSMKRRK